MSRRGVQVCRAVPPCAPRISAGTGQAWLHIPRIAFVQQKTALLEGKK